MKSRLIRRVAGSRDLAGMFPGMDAEQAQRLIDQAGQFAAMPLMTHLGVFVWTESGHGSVRGQFTADVMFQVRRAPDGDGYTVSWVDGEFEQPADG